MSATEDLHVDSKAIERYDAEQTNAIALRSIDDIKRLSLIFVQSGMFKSDSKLDADTKLYQAGVKIIAGVEFGIQPFAAMRGINIINGNAEMSANLMAAKVKAHPKYDYRVKKWDQDGCELTFYEIPYPGAPREKWEELGPSTFDADDARRAGLTGGNWHKFARNMYFARAISNGVRIHCPDIFYGAPVYTEGEISGEFEQQEIDPAKDASHAQTDAAPDELSTVPVEGEVVSEGTGPLEEAPEPEPGKPTESHPATVRWIADLQRERIMALANDLGWTKEQRIEFISIEIERDVTSVNELTYDEASKAIEGLVRIKEEGGAK